MATTKYIKKASLGLIDELLSWEQEEHNKEILIDLKELIGTPTVMHCKQFKE
jgi:hypothetical protein